MPTYTYACACGEEIEVTQTIKEIQEMETKGENLNCSKCGLVLVRKLATNMRFIFRTKNSN